MRFQSFNRVVLVTSLVMGGWSTAARALAHEGHGGHAATPAPRAPAARETSQAANPYAAALQSVAPVHGGQLAKGQRQYFEVVYLPRETRIYLYGAAFQPLSARGAGGALLMQVRGNPQVFRNRLQYAAQPAGSAEQDYLVAAVDVTQIRDGDMQVTFDLTGLPALQERSARFSQTFALARGAVVVTVVPLTAADRQGIARQRTCPVMEGGFDHGDPIKLMIGNQILYVCCKACIEEVKKDPQAYLRKMAQAPAGRSAQPDAARRVVATRASNRDQAAVQAQALCPVMNQPLGAHGVPWKVSIGDRDIFVCCAGCVRKVEQDPQR